MRILLLSIATLLIAALQARLPTLWWLGGIRLELMPAVAAFMALQLPFKPAMAMAVLAGLAQDALSAAPFGISALAYGSVALLCNILRETLDPDLPPVHVAIAAVMSVAGAVAAFCVVGLGFGSLVKMALVALLAGVMAVPVFLALYGLRQAWPKRREARG